MAGLKNGVRVIKCFWRFLSSSEQATKQRISFALGVRPVFMAMSRLVVRRQFLFSSMKSRNSLCAQWKIEIL